MKLRHTAALTLVGWSLIVPPFQGLPSPFESRANLDAPLNEWQLLGGSWSSAKDCDQNAKRTYELYLEAKQKLNREEVDRLAKAAGFIGIERNIFGLWMEQAYSHALCVPDNDPRLDGFIPIDPS
jgi:hypothetical protein